MLLIIICDICICHLVLCYKGKYKSPIIFSMITLFEKLNKAFLIISFVFLHETTLLDYMIYQIDVRICIEQRDLYNSYIRPGVNNMPKNWQIYVFLWQGSLLWSVTSSAGSKQMYAIYINPYIECWVAHWANLRIWSKLSTMNHKLQTTFS